MISPSIKFCGKILAEILGQPKDQKEHIRLFLTHLRKHRKMGWLPKIIREARKLVRIRERERTMIFETAKPLRAGDLILKMLERRSAKVEVRTGLIAGAVIRQGDRRIDASMLADLKSLRQAFLKK